jgi:hypothetical protein
MSTLAYVMTITCMPKPEAIKEKDGDPTVTVKPEWEASQGPLLQGSSNGSLGGLDRDPEGGVRVTPLTRRVERGQGPKRSTPGFRPQLNF